MPQSPLILTLTIGNQAFHFFNALRQKHFPPERNFIDAHLTLFHALPNEEAISSMVKGITDTQTSFYVTVKEPVSIGKGVVFKIESPELMQLHKTLQNEWLGFLSLQDRQKIWPHITVQNKVPAHEAQQLLSELKNGFTPFTIPATGLQVWEYLNGPWGFVEEYAFKV